VPEITALRALRYNPERFKSQFSKLIAPPYDVLSAEDKAALIRRHERNIVAVDLPHVPPKSAGPDELYAQAARTLEMWRADGTLVEDDKPVLYVYHQEYQHAARRYIRKKFFARMRLEEYSKGTVFPHELTFGGPKADRLKLMQATKCQLSAVFGLYSDPGNAISGLLDVTSRPADVEAELEAVANRLWLVQDEATIRKVAAAMASRPVFIADGHHRYGTALNYRDALLADHDLPMDHPARFILVGLCAMEDPGAVILPTHRVLSAFGETPTRMVLDALREGIDLHPASGTLGDPDGLLPFDAPDDVCLFLADGEKVFRGRFTQRGKLPALAPKQSPAWCQLDLAYLHRYLIEELISNGLMGGAQPLIQYFKSAGQAIQAARDCGGIAVLTKPCTMAQLRAVSEAGDLMPQKSTYFYPKLATGLVINPLA